MKNYFDFLITNPLFRGVTDEGLTKLLGCVKPTEESFKKGGIILPAGQKTDRFGILLCGKGVIAHEDFWGNRNIISPLLPGQIFGEVFALKSGAVTTVGVIAESDCEVLWIKSESLLSSCTEICPCHAAVTRNLIGLLAEKNLKMNEKIIHMAKRTTRQKLMSFLSAKAAEAKSESFTVDMDRQQLADYLSVERSAMCAELSRLQKDGYLSYKGNRFRLSGRNI